MQNLIMQHSRLVWKWVRHYAFLCDGRADVDQDDLYQAGCMGLIEAQRTFDSSKGAWSTWASFYIRKGIREALGRGKRLTTVSLDAPAYRDEDDGTTVLETVADGSIIPDDDRQIAREIAETVRTAVDALSEDIAPVVRSVGLLGLSMPKAAQRMGMPQSMIRKLYGRGLRQLRKNPRLRALSDLDLETPFHAHKGVAAFHSSGSSIVEDLVERRLRWEEELYAEELQNAQRHAAQG